MEFKYPRFCNTIYRSVRFVYSVLYTTIDCLRVLSVHGVTLCRVGVVLRGLAKARVEGLKNGVRHKEVETREKEGGEGAYEERKAERDRPSRGKKRGT